MFGSGVDRVARGATLYARGGDDVELCVGEACEHRRRTQRLEDMLTTASLFLPTGELID